MVPQLWHDPAGQPDDPAGRAQVRRHADRTHAGTAAAMRDAESLVQVQVADIGAEIPDGKARPRAFMLAPSMCRPAAILVHDLTDLTNA
jgi:hypothetical protein